VQAAAKSHDGDAESYLLGAEALRIQTAYRFDPLLAVNSSVVDPLPHQIEAVYRYLLVLPRIRFLLADDTGAGKTIMTGLLIRELLFRRAIEKVLIVTPGGLTKQWREDELEEKFRISARLVNRASFEADPGQFSRDGLGIFVVSMDFLARHEGCLTEAEHTQWDLIVVDEAHKLSAYEYGSKVEESERYKAIKTLARRTDHLLFLTATPHRGRKDTFRRLLMLLDEDLFQWDEHVSQRIQSAGGDGDSAIEGARNRFFLRRLKEEMVDWDGKALFKSRHTQTPGYDLTPEEKNLYDEVTKYVRSRRKEAKAKRNRNVELTLMVMQRRLASSIHAITRTLKNRLDALNNVLEILADPSQSKERRLLTSPALSPDDPRDYSEFEELADDEREEVFRRISRQVLTDDPEKVAAERDELVRLHAMAESLEGHEEAKFAQLRQVLDSSDVIRAESEKLLIFTEHTDTLESLSNRLSDMGYAVTTIHGGMDVDQRKRAQQEFLTRSKIMVATDAAGEGINLQFCRYLINWDIPWNPNRLEQRMGRIHRYGQHSDVWVYNLVARDTREGAVLQRVLTKLDVMREQMGSDRVYDVIADWLEDVPLVTLLEDAVDADDRASVEEEVEQVLDSATRDRAEQLVAQQKRAVFTSRLDLQAARRLCDASEEHRLQPLFIERFFRRAWEACSGTVRKDDHFPVWHIGPTPSTLLEFVRGQRKAVEDRYESAFVFDKHLVSVASRERIPERTKLLGPGHPLFDALVEWAIHQAQIAFAKGTALVDPNIGVPQRHWLVRSTILDGRVESRKVPADERLAIIALDPMGLRVTSPSYLLACLPPSEMCELPTVPDKPKDEIEMWAYSEITERQLAEARAMRGRECALRRGYYEHAFTDLITELQGELEESQRATLFGQEDPEEIDRLRARIKELKQRRQDRLHELEKMQALTADIPEIITEALVVPAPSATIELPRHGVPMRRDDEVEAIAIGIAMRYERGRGWNPVDVSKDGEHYDIRSESPTAELRFIEVKGRAETGAIELTEPELYKLRQLGSRAWLYVVTFCKSERPRLRIIQDPIPQMNPEMLYRDVQFLVAEDDWAKCGTEVPGQEIGLRSG